MRRVLLANHPDLLSEEWIAKYKELGVYGVGLNKKYIVVTNPDRHINFTNTELIDRVGAKQLIYIHCTTTFPLSTAAWT